MQHIEGVLKDYEIEGEGKDAYLIITIAPYYETKKVIGIRVEDLLAKAGLKNEKVSVVTYEEEELEDVVHIRGIAKNIPLFAQY